MDMVSEYTSTKYEYKFVVLTQINCILMISIEMSNSRIGNIFQHWHKRKQNV